MPIMVVVFKNKHNVNILYEINFYDLERKRNNQGSMDYGLDNR